jgi:ABC-type antimicrobial peptide transport system permease subunit
MTVIGVSIGAGATYYLGKFAESLLFEMKGRDTVVLASSVVLLAVIALAAGLLPAIRASRIDPMRALRYE